MFIDCGKAALTDFAFREECVNDKLKLSRTPTGSGPVKYIVSQDQPGLVGFTVDYENAPIPPHYYVADFYHVTDLGMVILMEFGKLSAPSSRVLRSKVEIYFPVGMFINQFFPSFRDFRLTVERFVQSAGYAPVETLTGVNEPEKVQTLQSNNALAVMTGSECMIDFFYISPRDMWIRTPKRGDIDISALVRVICTPTLMLGLLNRCNEIAQNVKDVFVMKEAIPHALESK